MSEESEENQLSEKLPFLKPVFETVKKIGLAKIILLAIVVVSVWWFYNLPKPGALFVTVTELDSNQQIAGTLVSLEWPDGNLLGDAFTQVTDETGVASFTNVPTQRELVINTDPGQGNFAPTRVEVKLENGGSKSEKISIARTATGIELAPLTLTGTVSETCVKQSIVTITNNGQDSLEAALIGSGALQTVISSQPTTILPGSSENLSIYIDVSKTGKKKGESLTGELRLKGMNKKVSLNLKIVEPPKVEITPSSLLCPAGKQLCQQIVTIKNSGANTLNNLVVEPSAEIASVLENGDVVRYYNTDVISAGGKANFGVSITPSSPVIGVITVKADCFEEQITVQAGG